MLEMRHNEILIIGTSSYGRWSYFFGNSMAIYPKTKEFTENLCNPLGLHERESAWFVFSDKTQLNDVGCQNRIINRLSS